jgi:uncharacterized protein
MVRLRRFLRKWHRDIGYFFIGLTVIFSISGIAVNHIDDWNPNYSIQRINYVLDPVVNESDDQLAQRLIKTLNIKENFKTLIWDNPNEVKLFFSNDITVMYNLDSGIAVKELVHARFLLRDFNTLHLNHLKGYWVWISDIFAVALIFLALSALFMVKGKNGFWGRGGILTALGVILPIIFLIFS